MLHGITQYNPPSRFLDEIPEALVTDAEGSRSRRKTSTFGSGNYSSADRERSRMSNRESIIDAAMKRTGPAPSGAEDMGLKIGDDVMHAKFGEGVIIDISGSGDKAEARVRFPDVGEKQLLLSWAPLEKL